MLAKVEDADSLANLCLWKLYQASQDFKYDPDLSEEHNERRFIAMVRTYVTRILIDHQYSANLQIRKPKEGLVSTTQLTGEEDDSEYQPRDKSQSTPCQQAMASEMRENLDHCLTDDEREIVGLLCQDFSAEDVARRLGMRISRVRYLIYARIQPRAKECCV